MNIGVLLLLFLFRSLSPFAVHHHQHHQHQQHHHHQQHVSSTSLRAGPNSNGEVAGLYLGRMVQRKKIIVDGLLRRHNTADDPLVMRMTYMLSSAYGNVTRCWKRPTEGPEGYHTMSAVFDMKRRSPTIPEQRNIVDYPSAGKFAEMLTALNFNSFLVNTDEVEYGGDVNDVKEVVRAAREIKPEQPPACIAKDIFIHPIQIAQAVENGATGVLLIASVVGHDLEKMLDACTIMGIEGVVEVHTPTELEYALSCGAVTFIVNRWDRMTGVFYPKQANALSVLLPMNCVALVAGRVRSMEDVIEIGYHGYDGVVLGRDVNDIADIRRFVEGVHLFRGRARNSGYGMKCSSWEAIV